MKGNVYDYFSVVEVKDYNKEYYKITDKITNRFCYCTSSTLDHMLTLLLKCLEDGYYKPRKNFSINQKVLKIFLDEDMAKTAYEEANIRFGNRQLRSYMTATIKWKCVDEYLEKRKWYIDYSKTKQVN